MRWSYCQTYDSASHRYTSPFQALAFWQLVCAYHEVQKLLNVLHGDVSGGKKGNGMHFPTFQNYNSPIL